MHKHDYDELQTPGFQWFAHDATFTKGTSVTATAVVPNLPNGSVNTPAPPERHTLTRYFQERYKDLPNCLRNQN